MGVRAEAQTYTTEFRNGELKVDLVKRSSDETVLVKGTITNTSQNEYVALYTGNFTERGVFVVKLQDLKSKKEFEQVKVQGRRVGSENSDALSPGQSTKFWARITAPPKDVKQVSVIFGSSIAPLDEVTISE